MIMVPGDRVVAADLASLTGAASAPVPSESDGLIEPLHDARDRFERDYIVRALAAQQGNISRTAQFVGMERSALHRKLKQLGVELGRSTRREV